MQDPQQTGRPNSSGSLLSRLVFLVPPVGGFGAGLAINWILIDDYTRASLWQGTSIEPESLPDAWLVRIVATLAVFAVWLIAAGALKGSDKYAVSLRRVAPAFSGFLLPLVLNFLEVYTGVGFLYWCVLALVFACAFFFAWLVAVSCRIGQPCALALKDAVERRALRFVVTAAVLYFAVSWTMALLQYRAVRISYHDCAGFDEMLWRTLNGEFLRANVFGDRSFLGQHFEFIHLFFLPLYALWPGLPFLTLTQSLGLASGAIPVYLLATRKLDSRFAATLFSVAYLFYAPMQYTEKRIIFEIYLPENLAIPSLLWALYFFECRNMTGIVVSGFFAAACKEDMVMPIAIMGLLSAFRGRKLAGLLIFAGATFWFFASLLWIIPYFEGGESHVFSYFHGMGGSTGAIIRNVVLSPAYTLKFVFAFHRVDFLLMMLVPMGCLALFSRTAIFIFLPSIASNALASWEPSSSIFYHYHISLVPFAVGGAVMGAANVLRNLSRMDPLWGGVLGSARAGILTAFLGTLVLGASFLGDVAYGKFPWCLRFYNPVTPAYWRHIYVQTPRAKYFVETVLPSIPKEAKVCASQYLAPRFTHYASVYVYGQPNTDPAKCDYAVIERDEPSNPATSYMVCANFNADDKVEIPGFELVDDREGIYIFKRVKETGAND
jgi:uncharacterized membrane protein